MKSHFSFAPVSRTRRGFTLIELLVVMTVMGLLLAMSGAAFQGSLQTQTLGAAARQLAADLDYAALLARKENRPVEILFYKFVPADDPAAANAVRAYQFGVLDGFSDTGAPKYRFLIEPKRMPSGVAFSTETAYNSLMSQTAKTPQAGQLGGVPETYTYYSYQIRPNGTTTLDVKLKHPITLMFDKDLAGSALPPDFRTVLVNPVNARTRVY